MNSCRHAEAEPVVNTRISISGERVFDSNDGKPVPSWAFSVRLDPERRKERRCREGLPEIFDPAGGL
jgi:hypothetical protein